jgi:hypothetical protein
VSTAGTPTGKRAPPCMCACCSSSESLVAPGYLDPVKPLLGSAMWLAVPDTASMLLQLPPIHPPSASSLSLPVQHLCCESLLFFQNLRCRYFAFVHHQLPYCVCMQELPHAQPPHPAPRTATPGITALVLGLGQGGASQALGQMQIAVPSVLHKDERGVGKSDCSRIA